MQDHGNKVTYLYIKGHNSKKESERKESSQQERQSQDL